MKIYRITTNKFCCAIIVDMDVVIKTAPILRKFKGQKIDNLKKWINKIDGKIEEIK